MRQGLSLGGGADCDCRCCNTCLCKYAPEGPGPWVVDVDGAISVPFPVRTAPGQVVYRMTNTLAADSYEPYLGLYGYRRKVVVDMTQESFAISSQYTDPFTINRTLNLNWNGTKTEVCSRSVAGLLQQQKTTHNLTFGSGYVPPASRTILADRMIWAYRAVYNSGTSDFWVGSGADGTGPQGLVRVRYSAAGVTPLDKYGGDLAYCEANPISVGHTAGSPPWYQLQTLNGTLADVEYDLTKCSTLEKVQAYETTSFLDGRVTTSLEDIKDSLAVAIGATGFSLSSHSVTTASQGIVSGSAGSTELKLPVLYSGSYSNHVMTNAAQTSGGASVTLYSDHVWTAVLGGLPAVDKCYLLKVWYPPAVSEGPGITMTFLVSAQMTYNRVSYANGTLFPNPVTQSFSGNPSVTWAGEPNPMDKWKDPTPFTFPLDVDESALSGTASTLVASRN